MSRRVGSIDRTYFDALYAADPDPWRFATSDYEREKYAASLAALPDPTYRSALEVGCSIGVFTRALAARCERLLALDVADAALGQARQHCSGLDVIFENRSVPDDWPQGRFDLVVLSEVLYYLDLQALARVAAQVDLSLLKGGIVLLVHYLGETDYPITGDDAAEAFIAALKYPILSQSRTDAYRLDLLRK
jgi:predicted TPR repeat methyltransferase